MDTGEAALEKDSGSFRFTGVEIREADEFPNLFPPRILAICVDGSSCAGNHHELSGNPQRKGRR